MPKFYQHFDPSKKSFEKIVKLKYIDDISDDDFILYVFDDGSKCNKDFIGAVDVADPLRDKCMMVELVAPVYKWTVKKSIIKQETAQGAVADDGNFYEPAVPESNQKIKDGSVRVEAFPPKLPRRWEVEPDEIYLLSEHPELENGGKPVVPVEKKVVKNVSAAVPTGECFIGTVNSENSEKPLLAVEKEPIDWLSKDIFLDFDGRLKDTENVVIKFNGKEQKMSKERFVELMFARTVSASADKALTRAGEDIISGESVLIKSMIDKSKKKKCKITLDVLLELPPREVYDTLISAYDETFGKEFVRSLTARIEQNKLIESLAAGLAGYYDSKNIEKHED